MFSDISSRVYLMNFLFWGQALYCNGVFITMQVIVKNLGQGDKLFFPLDPTLLNHIGTSLTSDECRMAYAMLVVENMAQRQNVPLKLASIKKNAVKLLEQNEAS